MQKRWILVLAIVIFLVAYGLWPDLNKAVNGGFSYALGETWTGLTAFGGSIAANPFYQQFHSLIWFIGGIVFTYAIMRIHLRQRIAQKIHGTIPKVAPATTVVEVRAATPSYATSRPPVENKAEVSPIIVEPKKEPAETTS